MHYFIVRPAVTFPILECELSTNERMSRRTACVGCRPQHTGYSGVAKVDVSEDPEPSLSKVDVILTFTLEVCPSVVV